MAFQQYGLTPFRIGKFAAEILKLASTREVLCKQGRQVEFPQNRSDTYIARRWIPYGASASNPNVFFPATTAIDRNAAVVNAHLTTEGVTGQPDSLVPQDISVIMTQYTCLYGMTDKMRRLSEDDIPAAMAKQIAQRVSLVNESYVFGVLKACTNVFFGGAGTTRATTNGPLTLPLVRRITRNLANNSAEMVTEVLKGGKDYGSSPVEGGYFVYGHTDLAPDVRDMPGFTKAVEYATGSPMPNELGAVENFRFILSPILVPILDGGASVASTPGYETNSGVNNDVYQFIVVAADAWSQISVRGNSSIKPTYIDPGEMTKSDPHGQRGYAGAMWWKAALIENSGWMATGNVLCRKLL